MTASVTSLAAQCDPQWWPGQGVPGVNSSVGALANWDPDGAGPSPSRLVVAGGFAVAGNTPANCIATYDPGLGVWSPLGGGLTGSPQFGLPPSVFALAVMPNGDLVAAGRFTTAGGVAANRIARWNGTAWSPLGSGTDATVNALAMLPSGELAVGGNFAFAGGQVSAYFARYAASCPATVAPAGSGCAGSGGDNVLSATTLPWTGSTYRTRGVGLAPAGFVVSIVGFSPLSLPLNTVMATFPAGCTLHASPDLMDVVLSDAGTADLQLAIPDSVSFVGCQLRQQLVVHEVDANLNFVQSTSSNALLATIGVF